MVAPFRGDERYRVIDEARIVETLIVHGWRFESAAGQGAMAEAAARAALDRLVAIGLPFAGRRGTRFFDPAEVINFVKWASFHHAEPTWTRHFVASARREAWDLYPGQTDRSRPPAPGTHGKARYAVTIRRAFNLRDRRAGEPVRLRLPVPLEEATSRDVKVEFLGPAGGEARARILPGRIEAVPTVPRDGVLELGMRATFTAWPITPDSVPRLDPDDVERYTRPSEGLIKVNQRVRALAAELSGGDTSPLSIAWRFWNYIFDHMACGPIHYDQLDPAAPLDRILDDGWFDCQTGSALLASLCRARGIPARIVTGYQLHLIAPSFHTWAEIWIEGRGWLPFDLDCWELSNGGRDAAWRDYHFGRLDHRMVVERPPLVFCGLGAVRLRGPWHMTMAMEPTGPGVSITFTDGRAGDWIYREHIAAAYLDRDGPVDGVPATGLTPPG